MKKSLRIWRGIAVGGLSLALVGGVGLPVSAWAAGNKSSEKMCQKMEHRHAMLAMREKMLAQAKAEDATLQKLVAELNKAPEAKKVDLEAAILTKLVAQHHQRLGEWESLHAKMTQFRKEQMQMAKSGMSGCCLSKGTTAKTASTSQN
jgi:hypothetical protein